MPAEEQLVPDSSEEEKHPGTESSQALEPEASAISSGYVAYTVKLPSEQLAALQSIWLELKKMYGTNSPDKSGMIQQAVAEWLKRWDGPDRQQLLRELLEIRQDTRRRQYGKIPQMRKL